MKSYQEIIMLDIEIIRQKCSDYQIRWSMHAVRQMEQRQISREDVLSSIYSGEIIEQYPDFWLNPACLIYGKNREGKVLHTVVGMDDQVHIVTVYYPDASKFESDLKTRRKV